MSGPALTTMLGEQLGVEMEKQEGFGSGLWSEIKRRHPRGGQQDKEGASRAGPHPSPHERRLALIDGLPRKRRLGEPDRRDERWTSHANAELESLRQQLTFAATRLDEERAATRERCACSRSPARSESWPHAMVEDWQERAARAENSEDSEQAAAELAELEATVTELRAEVEAATASLRRAAEAQDPARG